MPEKHPRLISFYLPQYHPIPENDLWWGKGFTEWTNVGRAKPLFPGHNQPRVPADLGYYDLRLAETREAQAALAREHGIHGFCYYHYWFNGRRLLERPFNEVLASGKPEFPFCLCWANENWTRAWDGLEREVLIQQHYNSEDDLAHMRWLANAFRDPRYIRVHGKPLFLVYRVASLPDPMQTVSVWREEARRLGIGELFLCSVESRVGGSQSVNPARIGFDAAVEFQPDGLHFPKPLKTLNDYGGIFDYRSVVEQMLRKPDADYLRFPCLAPGWDNSARRKENPTIITGSTPELYGQWLEGILRRRSQSPPEENIVFINAWIEWGEGAYLEPDQLAGRAYLEMTREILARHAGNAVVSIEAQTKPEATREIRNDKEGTLSLSVCMPVYNGNKFLEEAVRSVLNQSFKDFELIIVDDCSTEDPAPILGRFKDPRIQFHRNPVRQGLVGNWNRCVELSRGRLVCVFHQDDVMLPDNLRRKAEALERNPRAALAYSDARVVEEDLSERHPGWFTATLPNEDKVFAGREFFEKLAAGDNLVCCPSAVFRRAAFEQLGKFDPQLPYTADWEMWLRLALRFDVAYLKEPLILYRVHDRNETHRFKGLKEIEQGYRAKMTALKRAVANLPEAGAIQARVAGETARKVLSEMRNRGQVKTAKDLREWLQFAAEAQRASLADPSFTAASDWFLAALEDCAASLSGGSLEEQGWSDAEEQQFAQARQFEIEGRPDRALPLLERLAAVKPASARVWFQLGRAQTVLGQFAAAEKSWTVVIEQRPKDWLKSLHAHAMRGSACEKQGRKADALADFARGAQLALYEGCPDLACELDQLMGLLLNGGNGQRKNPTKEQLRNYALAGKLLEAVGRDIGRPGPISTFEFERANTVWEQFLSGSAVPHSLAPLMQGFEAVVAGLAKQHLERAIERTDADLQRRILAAWTIFSETAGAGTVPEGIVEAFARLAPNIESTEPIVSIIIPTFNRLDMTRRCLESLAKHRSKLNVEIIVVDNASTDGTVEFLKGEAETGRLRAIVNPENRGFSKACNQGARAAVGRDLLFLNNDTEVQAGWLEPLVETLDADERVCAVGSKLLFPDRTIQHAGVAVLDDRQLPDPLVARHIHYRKAEASAEANQPQTFQVLTAACVLIRKTAFERVGGFDEEYWNGYEDVDLCFKLRQEGGLLVYQPRSVVLHFESQSGPERFRQVAHNIKRLHQKWIGKVTPDYIVAADGVISQTTSTAIAPYVPKSGAEQTVPIASIIILAHNQIEHTRLCLDSIRARTPLPHELILVDNGSTDGTAEYFRSLAERQDNVTLITNGRNLGFAGGNNQGLAVARGDCVVLLNNDTVVTDGWLEKMLAALQRHPDMGIVGPMSNYVAGPQLVKEVSYKNLEELPAFAAEWSRAHAGQAQDIGRVVGFCLLARRSVIERIGGLDEQFGSGNFEDDDFCLRAGFAGFRICIAQDAYVHHTGSRTFAGAKIDYRESMLRNWKLFKAKWGMPADAPIEEGYRLPASLPSTAPLKVNLPGSGAAERGQGTGKQKVADGKFVRKTVPLVLPPCALVGRLTEARELLKKKQLEPAWTATVGTLASRPFHPEAALLLAEIAQAAGDSVSARHCAQHARNLAPEWKPARQFLKGNLRGNQKPAWLVLPPAMANPLNGPGRLSVCLITKNEEKFLGQCLASVRELPAQIVVVDTGSSDRTVEIAKQAGAEVHEFAWCDDFSAARNEALKFATGDWVFFLDADEELLPAHRETILQEMQAATVIAWRLPIIDQGREQEGCSYVPRLFRNAPGLFYVGRVHEQVFTSIEVRRQEWGLENRLGKSALLHHGYTSEMVAGRDKIARNLRLLERAIEELPDEPNLVMNLGLELIRSGRLNAGLERYREAVQLMSALPAAQIVPELRETLLTQYATQLMAAKRFAEIAQLWRTPFAKSAPMTASQHFVLGLALLELKEPAEAAEQMRQCVAKREKPALSPVNAEIFKAGPNHCLALALTALKQNDGALAAFRAALADEPKSRPARFDLARLLFERGEAVEALKLLNELVAESPGDAQVWQFGGQIALSRPEYFGFARDWTGEAHKHFPQHPVITLQRAEALLLAQDADAALPLWTAAHSPKSARHLAALVMCEAVTGKSERQFAPGDEPVVSQELFHWYRLLVAAKANRLVTRFRDNLDSLRTVTPSFVKAWEAAAAQAKPAAVTA